MEKEESPLATHFEMPEKESHDAMATSTSLADEMKATCDLQYQAMTNQLQNDMDKWRQDLRSEVVSQSEATSTQQAQAVGSQQTERITRLETQLKEQKEAISVLKSQSELSWS